eukprot:SAG31_NODE_3382_length_4335_cov_2.871813_5_plen_106_part_00
MAFFEPNEGSAVARALGRAWTTHTGSNGSVSAGGTGSKIERLSVPDWVRRSYICHLHVALGSDSGHRTFSEDCIVAFAVPDSNPGRRMRCPGLYSNLGHQLPYDF